MSAREIDRAFGAEAEAIKIIVGKTRSMGGWSGNGNGGFTNPVNPERFMKMAADALPAKLDS
jgi:hypothetical protein